MLMECFLATKLSSLITGFPETTGLCVEGYEVVPLYVQLAGMHVWGDCMDVSLFLIYRKG